HGIVAEAGMLFVSVIANNRVSESGTNGIFIDLNNTTNRITGNFSTANGSKDFLDSTTGTATAATADVWIKNIGLNRAPSGIVRPKIQTALNAERRGDIALQNVSGNVLAWLMNGNTITNGVVVGSASNSLKVVASGDFN